MIDKKTLAQRLGKDLRTISRYMRRGILPYYKLGRTVMFDWEGVKRSLWLLAKNVEGDPGGHLGKVECSAFAQGYGATYGGRTTK